MQENHLFEYAVIRVVPRVEREEFLNVGVILYSRQQNFLQALFKPDELKLKTFSDKLDIEEVKEHLIYLELICDGTADSGHIGQLDMAYRFSWMTETRSNVEQTSKVHHGFCNNAAEAIQKLFTQLVL